MFTWQAPWTRLEVPTVHGVTLIHYDIDDVLHRRVKAAAALEGLTLKAFLERALEEAVERSSKRRR